MQRRIPLVAFAWCASCTPATPAPAVERSVPAATEDRAQATVATGSAMGLPVPPPWLSDGTLRLSRVLPSPVYGPESATLCGVDERWTPIEPGAALRGVTATLASDDAAEHWRPYLDDQGARRDGRRIVVADRPHRVDLEALVDRLWDICPWPRVARRARAHLGGAVLRVDVRVDLVSTMVTVWVERGDTSAGALTELGFDHDGGTLRWHDDTGRVVLQRHDAHSAEGAPGADGSLSVGWSFERGGACDDATATPRPLHR